AFGRCGQTRRTRGRAGVALAKCSDADEANSATATVTFKFTGRFRDCSKDTGLIQLGPDGVMRGFVDGLRLGLHATYPAPSEHESALMYARDRPAFASCDSAGSPAPRHARWRVVACRRVMSGPSPTWVQRAS